MLVWGKGTPMERGHTPQGGKILTLVPWHHDLRIRGTSSLFRVSKVKASLKVDPLRRGGLPRYVEMEQYRENIQYSAYRMASAGISSASGMDAEDDVFFFERDVVCVVGFL